MRSEMDFMENFTRVTIACIGLACGITPAQAQVPLEQIIALSNTAVPVESAPFSVPPGQSLDIRLLDLGASVNPAAALRSIRVGLMRGAVVVDSLSAPGTKLVNNALGGTYVLRIVGEPADDPASGPFSLVVTTNPGGVELARVVDTLSRPPPLVPPNVSVVQESFTVATAGQHEVKLTDLVFKDRLTNVEVLIASRTASPPVLVALELPGSPSSTSVNVIQSLPADTYDVFAVAESPASINAGVFSISVRSLATSTIAYSSAVPVGQVSLLGTSNLQAGAHVLTLNDFAFPGLLARSGALVLRLGAETGRSAALGDTPLQVTDAGPHQILGLAAPTASAGAGSFAVAIAMSTGSTLFSSVKVAGGDPATGTPMFAFPVNVAAAGDYVANLRDFQFPTALATSSLGVAQGTALVGSRSLPGSLNATLAAGQAFLLLVARPPVPSGGTLATSAGLAGVELSPASGGAPIFDVSQGVGGLFKSFPVTFTGTTDYRFSVTDTDFPARFAELAVVITRGNERVGSIFGEGTFDVLRAPAGNYFFNVIARVDATEESGILAVSATTKPPDPVITFTANPVRPTSGGTTSLTWSTQDATACTASGAWSGSRPTSGTETSPAITISSSFTLTCTGDGGSTASTVTVNPTTVPVTPPPSSGGGGSLGLATLLALLLCFGWRARRRLALRPYTTRHPGLRAVHQPRSR
jgi:hypothetical protein